MAIGINGIGNENLKTLQLERVSVNIWKHNHPVELLVPSNIFLKLFCCESDLNHAQ
jgi:hypothetical protein